MLGCGISDAAPASRFTLDDQAKRIEAVMATLDVRAPVVVGHSQGAPIALALLGRLAADDRRRPAGVVLVNPVCPWTRRPILLGTLRPAAGRVVAASIAGLFRVPLTRYILGRRVFASSAVPAEAVSRYADPWSDPARARTLLAMLRDWRPAELEPYTHVSEVPTHIVCGERDRRIPTEHGRRLAKTLGGAFTEVIGAGHIVPEEEPEVLAEIIRELGISTSGGPAETGLESDKHSESEARKDR